MMEKYRIKKTWTMVALSSVFIVFGAHEGHAGGAYSGTSSHGYNNSVDFYQQSSPTRSNTGGGDFSSSVYGGSSSRTRFSSQGLTGSATYSGPGSFYNTQRMNYFSAGNGARRSLKIYPVTKPAGDSDDYKAYWRQPFEQDYYKAYWRD